VPILTISKKF